MKNTRSVMDRTNHDKTRQIDQEGGSARKSGQMNLRMEPAVHRQLKAKCALDGVAMSDVLAQLIAGYLSGRFKIEASAP